MSVRTFLIGRMYYVVVGVLVLVLEVLYNLHIFIYDNKIFINIIIYNFW